MLKNATCNHCDRVMPVEGMIKIDSPNKNYFYICPRCKDLKYGYNRENNTFTRQANKDNITVSYEFETSSREIESNWLYQYDFIPTHDSTVYVEWKSPIYKNIRGLAKLFRTIESKLHIGYDCGTHTNVGTFEGDEMSYIIRFYHSLFVGLSDHMRNNEEKAIKLFGRGFNRWACTIDRSSSPTNHSNFINVEHNTHLEFRMAKFVNANQFLHCTKFCIAVVKAVRNNFINNFNKSGLTREELKAHRLHKAKITSNKLIALFDKYTENL